MSSGNGHKRDATLNPAIKRLMEAEQQREAFLRATMAVIPGDELTIQAVDIVEGTDSTTGETVKLIKELRMTASGPVVQYMGIDMAERIAMTLLNKVRLARSGIVLPPNTTLPDPSALDIGIEKGES